MKIRLTFLLCLFTVVAFTQTEKVTVSAQGVPFKAFIADLEQRYAYQFYYNPKELDSVRVTVNKTQVTLEELLGAIFTGTEYRYYIKGKTIYLVYQRDIVMQLPGSWRLSAEEQEPEVVDLSELERRNRRQPRKQDQVLTVGVRNSDGSSTATITGLVRDFDTGDPIIGAAVFREKPEMVGTATDPLGRFTLTLPKGRHELQVQSVGMKPIRQVVVVYGNGELNFEMSEEVTALKEVVVESERDVKVKSLQMGAEKLDIRTMKNLPQVLGETDVFRVMLALPGVQSVGEGSSGINVRGGSTNQNLILFNNAVVFNPSHMFGFFSSFNPDVVANAELYKSGIGANFGGRISSVLDINSRTGNKKKWTVQGGISPITGRVSVEGPIVKEKTSLLLAGRFTYSDWILRRIKSNELRNSNADFYDYNAVLEQRLGKKHLLILSAYGSRDFFRLRSDTSYRLSDQSLAATLRSTWNSRWVSTHTLAKSDYSYRVSSTANPINAFNLDFKIGLLNGKSDFTFLQSEAITLNAGLEFNRYSISPGKYGPVNSQSTVAPITIAKEIGVELAPFAAVTYEFNSDLSASAGLRYSRFTRPGPGEIRRYAPDAPISDETLIETEVIAKGNQLISYGGFEPRFSMRYGINPTTSLKAGFTRMRQYIQMLTNTTAITPTDIWKLADPYVKPQISDQLSAGYFKSLPEKAAEISVEAYYKWISSTVDFKSGAELFLNPTIETAILNGKGKAYGIEMLLRRNSGRLNGWISYTWSRSFLKTAGEFPVETVNNGKWYPSPYDKPHSANLILNYKFNRRVNFSFSTVYSTGRPITIPIAIYEIGGAQRLLYSDRNASRIPDYFRMDLSFNIEGSHNLRKPAHGSWSISVYNLTGRANAYSIFFVSTEGKINGYKLSVFAQPIPTITYNFKF